MKNITKKTIDPIAEARDGKYFKKYSKEAKERICLGVEIYNRRKAIEMTQTELARKAKTTQKIISRIENGDINVGFSLLNRIAFALKFDFTNWSKVFNFKIPVRQKLRR